MSGALHNGEALNAHERLQPVELLPHSLGDAAQAHHLLEEGHIELGLFDKITLYIPEGLRFTGRNDQQECVVGQRYQRQSRGRPVLMFVSASCWRETLIS